MVDFRTESTIDGGYEVENLGEALEFQEFGGLDGGELAHLTQVIAFEVSNHDEFGDFFWGGEEVIGRFFISCRLVFSGTSAFDGAGSDGVSAEAEEQLRRGREDGLRFADLKEGGEWCRGDVAEGAIEVEGACEGGPRGDSPMAEVDLINIAGADVFLSLHDGLDEYFLRGFELEVEGLGGVKRFGVGRFCGGEITGEHVSDFEPFAGGVVEGEHVGVDSECE